MPEHPWIDPRPFLLGPDEARVGCVLVHGFTGSPAEMRPLGDALAARGYRVLGVQLPGHGTGPEILAETHWREWLEVVEQGHAWLSEDCDRVAVAGLSMGALLTTVFASGNPDVSAAVLLAPAFRVSNPLFPLVGIGRFVLDSIPAPSLPRAGLTSTEGWKKIWHYETRPVAAAWQLRQLQKRAWKSLRDLIAPTLIVQGARDQSVEPEGAREAFERLGAARRELLWLEKSGHVIPADVQLDVVVDAVDEWIAGAPADSRKPA
jgi:carboxylesterase